MRRVQCVVVVGAWGKTLQQQPLVTNSSSYALSYPRKPTSPRTLAQYTNTQATMLQRRNSPAQVVALLVLLLVPVSTFVFIVPSTSSHQLKRPLIMQSANGLEGEGASSTTSTLEVSSPAAVAAAVEVEVEVEADSR